MDRALEMVVDAETGEAEGGAGDFEPTSFHELTEGGDPETPPDDDGGGEPAPAPEPEKIAAEADPETPAAAAPAAAKADPAAPAKLISALRGEQKFDLPADAVFTHKVDGQDQQVTLQDLLNDFSGRTAYKARFNELNQEKQELAQRDRDMTDTVNMLHKWAVEEKNPRKAVYFLAEALGGNPHEVWKAWKEVITAVPPEVENMTEDERRAWELENDNKFLLERENEQKDADRRRSEARRQEQEVERVITEAGMDRPRYNELLGILQKEPSLKGQQITPEFVGLYHKELVARDEMGKLIGEVDSSLTGDAKEDLIDVLREFHKRGYSQEQLKAMAEQSIGKKVAQTLSRKVAKGGSSTTTPKPTPEEDGPLSFDEI